jgi:hypothetical protein
LGENINVPKNKNMAGLRDTNEEVALEMYVQKMKYVFVSPQQNAGQGRHIKTADKFRENVVTFKYLRTAAAHLPTFTRKLGGYSFR